MLLAPIKGTTGFTHRWQLVHKSMQDYSIGEVDSLVLKAYRGAGFSWGLAQEAGHAAAWMAVNGLPALDEFAHLLTRIDRQVTGALTPLTSDRTNWSNPAGQLCPVITGAAISETDLPAINFDEGLTVQSVYQPLILVPFIARSAKQLQRNLVLKFQGVEIVCHKKGDAHSLVNPAVAESVSCDVTIVFADQTTAGTSDTCRRARATQDSLNWLNKLAHRTYVPASEESRLAGAGAGLTDND